MVQWVILFGVIFVVGPMAFLTALRAGPTPGTIRRTALIAAVFAVCGMAVRFGLPARWGADAATTWAGIGLIWAAWIAILALGAQALRRAYPRPVTYRATRVLGAVGATVPWFGLASARLMIS